MIRTWLENRLRRGVPGAGREDGGDSVARIRARFLRWWGEAALPLGQARVRRVLHVGALCVVLGVVAGMYLRGLVLEYRVSWESTFLEAPAVDRIASTVLGPAAAVLGSEVPPVAPLRRPGSGPAAPWIHLWALTAALFVGIPRSLLLLEAVLRVRRLERATEVRVPSSWVERIRAVARSTARKVVVHPSSFDPTEKAWTTLRHLVLDLAGPRAEIARRPSLAYGDPPSAPSGDLEILVFPLAQTPEVEVHGELLRAFRGAVPDDEAAPGVLVVVDSSSFRRRLAGSPHGEERLEERRRAWNRVVATADLPALQVDLETAGAEELERAARAAMRPEGVLS